MLRSTRSFFLIAIGVFSVASLPSAIATHAAELGNQSVADTAAIPPWPGKPYQEAIQNAAVQALMKIAQSPSDPANHLALADAQIMQWCFGFASHQDTMPTAERATRQALQFAEDSSSAHTSLGIVEMGHWNWNEAATLFRRAVELDPQSAKAHHWLALYLSAMGKPEEALAQSRRAVELEPTPGYRTGLGASQYFARTFPEMITHMAATAADHPEFAPAYDWLGMAYVQEKQFDDSIRVYKKAVELSGNLAEIKAGLGHAYGVAGKRVQAIEVRDELTMLAEHYHIPPVQRAFVELSIGNRDTSLSLLERAVDERAWEACFFGVEPWLDDLREEPRFVALLERLSLK